MVPGSRVADLPMNLDELPGTGQAPGPAHRPAQRAARLLPPGRARDALHGVWLGHPLHPVLVQVPVGTWLSASLLDAWPGNETASGRAGAHRHGRLSARRARRHRPTGQSSTSSRCGSASCTPWRTRPRSPCTRPRRPSRPGRGPAACRAGGGGGRRVLGGHLAYRQSGGANQAEPVPHLVEPGWHDLMPAAELESTRRSQVRSADARRRPVVVIRDDAASTCSPTGAATCPGRCPTVTAATAA